MKRSGMYRIVAATGISLGLAAFFQNCSQVNFGTGDSKALVQGSVAVPDINTSTTTSTDTTSPTTQGICLLTCTNSTETNVSDEHEFNSLANNAMCATNPKPKSPVSCTSEDEGEESSLKPAVQSVSSSDTRPKTTCMTKSACDQIGANLASGKLVLMKVESNKVSTLRGTQFEPVDPSECEDSTTEADVKTQI